MQRSIFITGGTGYIGSRLIPLLARGGHRVKALVRTGSEGRLPKVATLILGDALKMDSYTDDVRDCDTFVHLIGTPHPSPAKAKQFHEVDLVSIEVAVKAARETGVQHFVYLSVAQPAPIMKAFIEVRAAGERMIQESNLNATFVRPWYVLGPGHWWAYAVLPFYWILERLSGTRESTRRLGLVTIDQILQALVSAIETPQAGVRIVDVPQIRELSRNA